MQDLNLNGTLLVAMPGMGDPRFQHAVVLICKHSSKGAMGLIINKPSADVRMSDVLDQLEIEASAKAANLTVHFGGPVEMGRGFVLHSRDFQSSLQTLDVVGRFGMTATLDVLEAIAQDTGPHSALMMLGYSNWGPGQLEEELAQNAWLTAESSVSLVFDTPASRKWEAALKSLGIDPLGLSAAAGRA
jgi:putative transcriptional regulator